MAADILPAPVRRGLAKFGADIRAGRLRRRLTVLMMAERLGVGRNTYLKLEKGDPHVGFGTYAMALFVLGYGNPFESLADIRQDDQGLLLDAERVPKRAVRARARRPRREATSR
jgi:transcriptional regulator with XRE-family HTH domain